MPTDPRDVAATDDANDIPRMARRFLERCQAHEADLRRQMKLRLQMYVAEGLQWDESERHRRDAAHRPMIEVNECKPPIDQVETDIRLNPPGPICHPVGGGATAETADVIAGLFRQAEYVSDAKQAYVCAGKHSAISGYGVIEYGTRYADDFSLDQEVYVIPNPDPSMWWFDPLAKGENREDALLALKGPRILSREAFELEYGKNRKVLDRGYIETFKTWAGNVQGMFGWSGDYASINTWTTGGKGPYWVAEFWRVEVKLRKKRMYTDNVMRFDAEAKRLTNGAVPKTDEDGDASEYERTVPVRTCTKYVVDACEVLAETEFIDDHIPALAILGPEIYIEGKLYRGSLLAGMIGPQRALNYTATSMMEIAGKVPRAPFIGTKGQFDDIGDDGVNKWATATTEDHAWLAVEPVQMVDEVSGRPVFAPLPQRNMMEASIQWLLGLAGFFKDAIQAASAYSATSLGKRTADQSGEAIKALQAESNKGTYSYPDGVNSGVAVMYQRWLRIFPKIMDAPRAATIISADGQNEQRLINQLFPHPSGAKNEDGTPKMQKHDITLGRYSVRVDAGPSPDTRNAQAQGPLANLFKAAPHLLAIPGVAAAYMRMLGDGNPRIDQIADMLPGGAGDQPNAQQVQGQLQQAQQKIQQLTAILQEMAQKAEAGIPKLQLEKYKADLNAAVTLAGKEIETKAQDAARASADTLAVAQMAHETALQADAQEHQRGVADQAARTQSAQSAQDAGQQADAAAQAQQSQQENDV
jgi:hypothetical protein